MHAALVSPERIQSASLQLKICLGLGRSNVQRLAPLAWALGPPLGQITPLLCAYRILKLLWWFSRVRYRGPDELEKKKSSFWCLRVAGLYCEGYIPHRSALRCGRSLFLLIPDKD